MVDGIQALAAMRDQQHRGVAGGREHVGHQRLCGCGVEMGRRLVQHQHGGVPEQRPRQHQPLALAAREPAPLLAHKGVDPVRQPVHPGRQPRPCKGRAQLVVGRVRPGEQQVLADRRVEQVGSLAGQREHRAHVRLAVVARVAAVDQEGARLRIEEPQQHVGDGRLTGSAGAHQRHAAARPSRRSTCSSTGR
jgi:hypothetical protein